MHSGVQKKMTIVSGEHPTVSFDSLVKASQHNPVQFPVNHNRCEMLVKEQMKSPDAIVQFAQATKPIVHWKALKLIMDFLDHKREHGSPIEIDLYDKMSLDQMINRLLLKRPFTFMGEADLYLLRNRQTSYGGFDTIGTLNEKRPLVLADYLSYDEMQLSALLLVATPSYFINNGNKKNQGKLGKAGSFEDSGVMIGMVGTRCEVRGRNEYAHMLITPLQNTAENGYGKQGEDTKKQALACFAKLYEQGDAKASYFPSYEEAVADQSERYVPLNDGSFINKAVYKQRLRMVIEPFLVAANEYAALKHKKAYVDASRIGLGSWAVDASVQTPLQLQVYAEILSEIPLPWISDINFGRFQNDAENILDKLQTQHDFTKAGNNIAVSHEEREPATKLTAMNEGKLLINNYAWDGNSYPGNEFWLGQSYLSASSDPAAACYSQIAELQNPLINPFVSGVNTHMAFLGQLIEIQQCHGVACVDDYDEQGNVLNTYLAAKTPKLKK